MTLKEAVHLSIEQTLPIRLRSRDRQGGRTSDLNCDSEMVSDIGRRANDEVG